VINKFLLVRILHRPLSRRLFSIVERKLMRLSCVILFCAELKTCRSYEKRQSWS